MRLAFLLLCIQLAAAATWPVVVSDFESTMSLAALVRLDGVAQTAGTLGAFVGDTTRGVVDSPLEVPFGAYAGDRVFSGLLYANTNGETVHFKFDNGSLLKAGAA